MAGFEIHKFYCMNCGKEGIPISRRAGRMHGKFHRKQLWCCNCKTMINHIECRSDQEVEEFKNDFKNGVFINESQESLSHCRNIRIW